MTVARPPVVSQSEWETALAAITGREKTVAEAIDQLAAARKRMPMVRVERDYRFEGPDGERSLAALFDGRSQLILYRFFFEDGVDGWPDAGCPGCSSWADGIGQLGLLHARDITFAMASPAPQENLRRYARADGLDKHPVVHDPHRAVLGPLRARGVVRAERLPGDGEDVYRTYFKTHVGGQRCEIGEDPLRHGALAQRRVGLHATSGEQIRHRAQHQDRGQRRARQPLDDVVHASGNEQAPRRAAAAGVHPHAQAGQGDADRVAFALG